jgi:uncharacterized membrane protein
MSWLRTLMLLALIVWIGGIIFFALVLAPTVFAVLPTRELAGNVVNPSLARLHWIGLICGLVFLLCSIIYNQLRYGHMRLFSASHVLVIVMLVLTAISHFVVTPQMSTLRANMGVIDNVPTTDQRRVAFNQLHIWSTRLESGVLLCGLGVVILTARRFS